MRTEYCIGIYILYFRSKKFKEFIAKCLVKTPDQRPTARELLEVSQTVQQLFF
jgi:serine/threonine protein kinase